VVDSFSHGRPVVGIRSDDVTRIGLALHGVGYPVEKWQLIDHAERDPAGRGGTDPRVIGLLWSLPTGRYLGLPQVLAAAARTVRGHPRPPGGSGGQAEGTQGRSPGRSGSRPDSGTPR
jgi:Protein of unknown function (DUF2795)